MPNFIHEMINMNKTFVLIGTNAKALLENNFVEKADSPPQTPSNTQHYKFTENYANYVETKLEELSKITGMLPEHIGEYIQTVIANDTVTGVRPVNIETKSLLAQGDTTGKRKTTQRKSSIGSKGLHTDDPLNGLIPVDQSLSKLSPRELVQLEHTNPSLYVSDPSEARIPLTKVRRGKSLEYFYIPLDLNSGKADFIYPNPDSPPGTPKFLYEKNGKEDNYDVADPYKALVKPLFVMGIKEDGKTLKYVADYDPLFNATKNFAQPHQYIPELAHDLGNVTEMQVPLVIAMKTATNGATNHGADSDNPLSFRSTIEKDLAQGMVMFKPDGHIDVLKTEAELVASINTDLAKGYTTFPNPRWGYALKEGKFVIPADKQRVDWETIHTQISDLKETAEKSQLPHHKEQHALASNIYELTIAIKSHQYREHFLGKDYDTSKGNPSYITGENVKSARNDLRNMEDKYLADYKEKSPTRLAIESVALPKVSEKDSWVKKVTNGLAAASKIKPQDIVISRRLATPQMPPLR